MRLKSLELVNFRGFAGTTEVALALTGPVGIVGTNGAGKTTITDALAELLTLVPEMLRSQAVSHPLTTRPRTSHVHSGAEFATISAAMSTGESEFAWGLYYGVLPPGFQERHPFVIPSFFEKLAGKLESNSVLPFLAYLHASSSRAPEAADPGDFGSHHRRLAGYDGAFDMEAVQLASLERWFEEEENLENQERIQRGQLRYQLATLRTVRTALQRFLGHLGDSFLTEPRVVRSRPPGDLSGMVGQLALTKDGTPLFLSQLSDGERRLALMVLDTARRMAILNPEMSDALETPGVLLLDEVELHLHPRWQRRALPALAATFPQVQIIATTHSPQVIASVPNEALIVLDRGKVLPGRRHAHGRDSNSVLADVMGVGPRPAEAAQEIHELAIAMDKDPRGAEPQLRRLEEKFGADDPDLVRARALLDFMVS